MFAQGFSVCSSPVSLLKSQETGVITRLKSPDPAMIRKLLAMGLTKGAAITVEQCFPAFIIKSGHTRLAIDAEIARSIYVRVGGISTTQPI